ncbi:MAG TPA: sigma factor-like helix-turn-helix DNA-binding protein [Chthonomonadales bacterium]|nr:sigma factor-like helix-turn-helix DNA-binding protein [Chthonomonadales bacterium]
MGQGYWWGAGAGRASEDEARLEREADALLAGAVAGRARNWRTERQFARAGGPALRPSPEALERARAPLCQTDRDEMLFLLSVTPLPRLHRLCARLWADRWTQREIAAVVGCSQQRVSQVLRQALAACLDSLPVSFESFSRHSVYRPPLRVPPRERRCTRCGEAFDARTTRGRLCWSCRPG